MDDVKEPTTKKRYGTEAQGDLREFLREARKSGELEIIDGADPELEMGALFELSHEQLYPPVLLGENIRGVEKKFRMMWNVRTAKFVVGTLDLDAVKAYRQRPKEKREPIPPREVNYGPLLENVEEGDAVDILKFPAPRWHEGDGGRYIGTECVVIAKDRDSDWINLGTYRVSV